jgi:AAA domain
MTRTSAPLENLFDADAVAAAESVSRNAIRDVLRGGGPRGAVVTAPAGAGKSYLISTAVDQARLRELRVAVAAPTNEQAFGLVRTIAYLHCAGGVRSVTFVPASTVSLPDAVRELPGVQEMRAKDARSEPLIVGTLSKLGDAFTRGDLGSFDLLLVDESYQADSAKYYATAGLAPVHLLVGDGGQISPFAAIDDPGRWRGLPEDPLQTAVGVLRRNHPGTPVYGLPITRRLDGRAVRIARLFYPDLPFAAAVLPGVRELRLARKPTDDPHLRRLDGVLYVAAREGWAHVELPRAPVLQADPKTVEVLATLVRRLFDRCPEVRCERQPHPGALRPEQVAVGVAHNDQKDFVRLALGARGLGGVMVETANKLQGLEFEVVFVWHPLAGLPEADGFHLDPGRLCVLLTRHRQACVVVSRVGDHELIEDQPPPPTPAYLGWDPDPVLDGWEIHREVFAALKGFKVTMTAP